MIFSILSLLYECMCIFVVNFVKLRVRKWGKMEIEILCWVDKICNEGFINFGRFIFEKVMNNLYLL